MTTNGSNTMTTFSNKCHILAELWMGYRDDEEYQDFVEYNDLGLPLAYAASNDIITLSKDAEQLIEETFDLFITGLGLEDTGFEDLESMLDTNPYTQKPYGAEKSEEAE